MKKTLTTLFAFFALALTACNAPANESSKEPEKSDPPVVESSKEEATSSKHTHSWGEWTQTQAPTCTEKGKEKRVCSECGLDQERDVAASGHNYVEDKSRAVDPTCSTPGKKVEVCSACGDEKESAVQTLDHDFQDVANDHVKEDGEVTTTWQKCSRDDNYKLQWDAQDAAKEASSGFTSAGKFTAKEDYVKYTFYSPISLRARLYVRIADRSASGDSPYDRETKSGNQSIWFDYYNGPDWKYAVKFNDVDVDQNEQDDITVGSSSIAMKELMYQDFLASGASELVAPWFELEVLEGQNTLRIERYQGYSVSVKDFRVIGTPASYK